MKYMLLIYDDEKAWASFSESQRQGYMGEYRQFTEAIKASGNHLSGSQLRETAAATKVQLRAGKRLSSGSCPLIRCRVWSRLPSGKPLKRPSSAQPELNVIRG